MYSFGQTLYTLWTHREPYEGMASQFEIFKQISEGRHPQIPDSIPKPLSDLTDLCRHKLQDERPSFALITQRLSEFFAAMPSTTTAAAAK